VDVGIGTPLWLTGLAVLVPLIWFYLRTRAAARAVSSLAVWRALAEPVVQRRARACRCCSSCRRR
jgi:hypothetical protein